MTAQSLTVTPGELRAAMVTQLQDKGYIRSAEVAAAFATVPRELFAPGAELDKAYKWNDTVVTRRDSAGKATSSISAPWLQAQMIEAARIKPGDRILEVGSGGYNCALLAEMTGAEGTVVTVDIDPWVTERASRFLAEAGYANVQVVTGDGDHVADPYGPFDVVIVTVGVQDAPWAKLLGEGGRMVIPIIVSTYTRSVVFTRHGDRWDGENPVVCGFISAKGACGSYEQRVTLAGAVHLAVECGPALSQDLLSQALTGCRYEVWTGITIDDYEGFFSMNLYLAAADERAGQIWKEPGSDTDLVTPAARWFTPALVEPDSFAFLTSRHVSDAPDERISEFGVHGHGPRAAELASQLATRVQEWDQGPRHQPEPTYTLYPAGAYIAAPATGKIFPRRHVQIALSWL